MLKRAMSYIRTSHTLPQLPYAYNALEPVISTEIMQLHHGKHHNAYVTNLNKVEQDLAAADSTHTEAGLLDTLKFNLGGHINHSIFWKNMCPKEQFQPPAGELLEKIEYHFGSLDTFVTKFNTTAAAIQGSGWCWLGYAKDTKSLVITTSPNQETIQYRSKDLVPLLGVDVWEHAYYPQYKNARPEYLKNIWQIINWKDVAENYTKAK